MGFSRSKQIAQGKMYGGAVVDANALGDIIFVDGTNGSDGNDGNSRQHPVQTLARALAVSAAGDTIIIAPGTYTVDVGTASLAPKANQTWAAARPSLGGAPNVVIIADADDSANAPVAIDVNGVVFRDIECKLVAGGTTALYCVDAAQTTAVRGLVFEDCWFNLNSVDASGAYACRFNDATNAITGLVMRRCRFVGGDATTNTSTYVIVGVGGIPDALIEGCQFKLESVDGDAVGISFGDPGAAAKSYGVVIRDNDFIGSSDGGDDAVGIFFAGAMTEDEIVGIIRTNYFGNCSATPITIDKANASVVLNYVGDDATGGTLVDPGT